MLWRHALQNIQNDCHQWLSRSFRLHRISLQRSPDSLAGLRGTYSKREGEWGNRRRGIGSEGDRRGEEGRKEGRGGDDRTNSMSHAWICSCKSKIHLYRPKCVLVHGTARIGSNILFICFTSNCLGLPVSMLFYTVSQKTGHLRYFQISPT